MNCLLPKSWLGLIAGATCTMALMMTGCTTSAADLNVNVSTDYPLASYERIGTLDEGLLPEASGLVISPSSPDLLWLLNDSGNSASIVAMDTVAMTSRAVTVTGARNRDWEDLARFVIDDTPWLLIADVGDNNAVRDTVSLYFVPEPAPTANTTERALELSLTYPGGPRDVEAVAVDDRREFIYALSKRTKPVALYRIGLRSAIAAATSGTAMQWQLLGDVLTIPQPTQLELKLFPRFGENRAQPTAMDISPDGTRLAILTYGEGYVAVIGDDGNWLGAVNTALYPVGMPVLPQAETIAIDDEGKIWITTERRDSEAPLIRLSPTPSGSNTPP